MAAKGVRMNLMITVIAGLILIGAVYLIVSGNAHGPTSTSRSTSSSSGRANSTSTQIVSMNVFGSVVSSGDGTFPKVIIFSGPLGNFNATVTNNHYSTTLPAPGQYAVTVSWKGAYPWQDGRVSSNPPTVSTSSSSGSSEENFNASTPDSAVTLTGHASVSGLGTTLKSVAFIYGGMNFNASVVSGIYSVRLPNWTNFTTEFAWAGSYPWQKGVASSTALVVARGPGETTQNQNISAQTPNSLVIVSGTVSAPTGETPTTILFSANGLSFSASVGSSGYAIQLANFANYTVTIRWTSGAGPGSCSANPASLDVELEAGAAATTNQNFSC